MLNLLLGKECGKAAHLVAKTKAKKAKAKVGKGKSEPSKKFPKVSRELNPKLKRINNGHTVTIDS